MVSAATLDADNFYERLGLDQSATTDAIKRAYRALLRQYPPERAPEEFKRLREAYETLGNPGSRGEYDRRPDPVIEQWVNTGLHAMNADEYHVAERYFKQVLLQQPDLTYVRNLLGLCFLYKKESAKAIAQFERLLGEDDAPAAWFANAAYAYQQCAQYLHAEKAFEEAIRRATESSVDYIVGLADTYLDQDKFARAAKMLEDAIKADGIVDFQDLRYFTKLLEARIRERDLAHVHEVLKRMKVIATDEEQRRYLAWKLGIIGQQLIAARDFRYAMLVARLARVLQPSDPDYFALEEIGRLLQRNDFAQADQLLREHVSFTADGWLAQLGGRIRQHMTENRVLATMAPISAAPTLYTINGIGTKLYGERDHDARSGSYVTTLYFVILFIPIFPITCYRVVSQGAKGWSFLGTVPYSKREKGHWMALAALVLIVFLSNAASNSSSSALNPVPAVQPVTPATQPAAGLQLTPATSDPLDSLKDSAGVPTTDDGASIETERSRIDSMKGRIVVLDEWLVSTKAGIDSEMSRIRAIEGGQSTYSTADKVYSNLVIVHNVNVDVFNSTVVERDTLYRDFKTALDIFNARVDTYNAHRRP